MGEENKSTQEQGQQTPSGQQAPSFASGSRHGAGVPWKVVLGLLLTAGAVLFIMFDSEDGAVFAYTVDKALENQSDLVGKQFRVRGKVQDGSIQAKPGTLDIRFQINHEEKLMTIAYDKPLPDTFKPGIEVIAEGRLGKDGVLVAEQVIAKCPSKYEEGAPTSETGALHEPKGEAKGGY